MNYDNTLTLKKAYDIGNSEISSIKSSDGFKLNNSQQNDLVCIDKDISK